MNVTVCDLSSGGQSAAAGGGEPWGSSSSGGGGLPRRYVAREDPERPGWHCPVSAPHPQRSTEPAFAIRIVTRNMHDAVLDNFQSFPSFFHSFFLPSNISSDTQKYAECVCKGNVRCHTVSETSLCCFITMSWSHSSHWSQGKHTLCKTLEASWNRVKEDIFTYTQFSVWSFLLIHKVWKKTLNVWIVTLSCFFLCLMYMLYIDYVCFCRYLWNENSGFEVSSLKNFTTLLRPVFKKNPTQLTVTPRLMSLVLFFFNKAWTKCFGISFVQTICIFLSQNCFHTFC